MAAHSLKDVPSDPAEGLTLAAILLRGDVRDALVAGGGRRLAEWPPAPASARVPGGGACCCRRCARTSGWST